MIDKDEYPQTAEIERRCVAILADLWHAPDPGDATGCSTTGSSEACMLAGMALKRRWAASATRPRSDVRQAEPGDGRQRAGVLGEVLHATGRSSRAWCRWRASGSTSTPRRRSRAATRTRSASSPSSARPSTAATSRSPRSAAALDELRRRRRPGHPGARRRRLGRDDRPVPRPRPGVGLPAAAGGVDQHLRPQVRPGLPGRRLGAVARRGRTCPRTWSSTSTTWAATCRPSR